MNKKILVIDDDSAVRKAFMLALEETDYQVDTADSGEKGFEVFRKEKHNLVFLDLKMPGMNGVETLREIRGLDQEIPVYIVTAFHEEFFDQLKSAEKDGLEFELLKKPIGGDQLVAAVKSALEGPVSY